MAKENDLITAAQTGDSELLGAALAGGANPNALDDRNRTALHWISQEGYSDMVHHLVAAGAEVNSQDGLGFTPLAIAVGEGHKAIVRELLKAGASPNIRILADGDGTAMHLACSWNRAGIVKLLVECGNADINIRDAEGKTPLEYAIDGDFLEIQEYLVKHDATR